MRDSRFTDQEMEQARETDVPALAEATGYTVLRKGSWRTLEEARHIRIKGNRYYDNYQRKWRDAITFLQDFANLSFPEAVKYLLAYHGYVREDFPGIHGKRKPKKQALKEEPVVFTLPEANADNRRVFAYLRKRGIADRVIQTFIAAGLLYEDKKYHNCVFVGRDKNGRAVFAVKRGTYDREGAGFKGDVPGSDKDIAFRLPCDPEKDTIHVFEAPIDLMSFYSLHRKMNSNAVALCCLHDGALERYLRDYPHIQTICLCLDADKWARSIQKNYYKSTKRRDMQFTLHYHLKARTGTNICNLKKQQREKGETEDENIGRKPVRRIRGWKDSHMTNGAGRTWTTSLGKSGRGWNGIKRRKRNQGQVTESEQNKEAQRERCAFVERWVKQWQRRTYAPERPYPQGAFSKQGWLLGLKSESDWRPGRQRRLRKPPSLPGRISQ